MNERANKWKASIKRPAKILWLGEFKVRSPDCQANVHSHNEGSSLHLNSKKSPVVRAQTGPPHLIPVLGLHMKLNQGLQVTNLQVGLGSIARVIQLLEVMSAHQQGLPLGLVQLAGNVN